MTVLWILLSVVLGVAALLVGRGWRTRQTTRMGHDPADNKLSNGFNAWSSNHPVLTALLFAIVICLALAAAIWNRTN